MFSFRKQLLFELPAQPLVSLKIKGTTGQEKTVPSPYIRYLVNIYIFVCMYFLFRSFMYNNYSNLVISRKFCLIEGKC